MKIPAPISSGPTDGTQQEKVRPEWANWLRGVFAAVAGWNASLTATATIDFASIPAQTQNYSNVTIKKAQPGDAVIVTPDIETAGLIYTGLVTAADTVAVLVKNFTAAAINPPSTTFRIIVLQN